ncbi:hypothetical protein DB30_07927 [Enhygromyxa salina]|uniref:Uncharacterized protein n=1 Tax=Enhygromyxa salina TaxID=215803 RepID=A0A0C2CQZ1_9BACT|nr:hypothetical protein [Enhygromyxa salina]KIG13596.1 hypothetical protein DB30_07927 [Enhygromyxa salina]
MTEQSPEPSGGPAITEQEMATMRRVVRKVSLILLGACGVGVLVFWLGWVRAPSPEQVCKHKIQLVHETVGEDQTDGAEALVGQLEANCVIAAKRKIQLRGKIVWAKYAKCVTSAPTLTEAERC